MTALVKVPAAYSLVRKHKVTRPGMLILNGKGKKVAFHKLAVGGGKAEAGRLARFLKKNAPRKTGKKKPQKKKRSPSRRGWY